MKLVNREMGLFRHGAKTVRYSLRLCPVSDGIQRQVSLLGCALKSAFPSLISDPLKSGGGAALMCG